MTPRDLVLAKRGLRFMGRHFPCTIGRAGLTSDKAEGDGATPRGTHSLVGCLYRPDRLAKPCDWAVPIRPADLWSDDPRDEDYNLMVRAPYPHRHERLSRADPMYDIVLITNWNWPYAERGRGSAIFLHQWRRPHAPTAGCVAFARRDLIWIAGKITHQTRLIIR